MVIQIGRSQVFAVWMNLAQAYALYDLPQVMKIRLGKVRSALMNDESCIE